MPALAKRERGQRRNSAVGARLPRDSPRLVSIAARPGPGTGMPAATRAPALGGAMALQIQPTANRSFFFAEPKLFRSGLRSCAQSRGNESPDATLKPESRTMRNALKIAVIATGILAAGPALADHLNIESEGIATDGNKVMVPSVLIDEPGFVVLHAVVDGNPIIPASIGHAYVEAGTTSDVTVEADYPLVDGEDFIAMLHYDTNGNGAYEFGEGMTDVDTPALNAEDKPYVKPFKAGAKM